MTPFEVKLAKRAIASSEYRSRRLDRIHREILYWVANEAVSNTSRQKQLCAEMQEMYIKRYKYYLNGFRKSNGQYPPGGGIDPSGDGPGA